MSTELANLFASKFIARPDVKAIQFSNGAWMPHQAFNPTTGKHDGPRIPWQREHLNAHLEGKQTFGHYLLSQESKCKLFAFDVDLRKPEPDRKFAGWLPSVSVTAADEVEWKESFQQVEDLRAAWLNRAHPARDFMKLQFKEIAHKLLTAIEKELEIPCLAAYSGNKGIHVYGFTGLMDAKEARWGAQIVLDALGEFEPLRGENFFVHKDDDPYEGFQNMTIEVFPKQDSLEGKNLGNLMRLPLGKNQRAPQEPTFFIDFKGPFAQLQPRDPVEALTSLNPWT